MLEDTQEEEEIVSAVFEIPKKAIPALDFILGYFETNSDYMITNVEKLLGAKAATMGKESLHDIVTKINQLHRNLKLSQNI